MTYNLQQPARYTPARYTPARTASPRNAPSLAARQARVARHTPQRDMAHRDMTHRDIAAQDHIAVQPERKTLGLGAVAVVVAIIVAAVVGFGSDAAASGTLDAVSESSQIVDSIEIYVVQPGDTLWAIANEISLPGEDVRPLVDALQELSGGSDLDVGQRLIIDHAMIRG